MIPYAISDLGLTLYIKARPVQVRTSHANYREILQCLKNEDYDRIPDLVATQQKQKPNLNDFADKLNHDKVRVVGDSVYYGNEQLHGAVVDRLLKMQREGLPIEHFVKFIENLMSNPSYRAVNELYRFLEACELPITEDGCFLAYKKVRDNYTDIHSGTFDNSVGSRPTMPRNKVNEDSTQTCSAGLHFCSFSYLQYFGSGPGFHKVVIVKVNPADVVSIPVDYNNAKARACAYEVVGELLDWNEEPDEMQRGFLSHQDEDYDDYDELAEIFDEDDDEEPESEVMTVLDASNYLGITESAVRKRADRGYSLEWVGPYRQYVRIVY